MSTIGDVEEFHAHVYFDAGTRAKALRLRERLGTRFSVRVGRLHDEPVGPHPAAMFEIELEADQLGPLVAWLMRNRDGLSVLVHPLSGDDEADHTAHVVWLGGPLPLDLAFLRDHAHVVHAATP
jgi:DOPA 4,5-dioxygenase